jgi:O-antigen ligase
LVVLPFAVLLLVLCTGKSSFIWLKRLAVQVAGGLLFFVGLRLLLADYYLGHISADMKFERSGEISNGRFDLWQQAWNHFIAAPWLGNGPGAFACFTWRDEASPHNLLLLLLSEWGAMVTLLVAAIALWVFVVMLRRLRSNLKGDPLALSLFASVVAIIGATQLQGMLIAPLGQMATVLIFGWAWGVFATKNFATLQSKAGSLSVLRIMHVTVTVALLALWVVMARYDLPLQKQLMTLPDGTIVLSYGPRYWADGHDHCPLWHQRKLSERSVGG